MKSPIKNNHLETRAINQLVNLIPNNSSIETFNFFTGDLEFSLCEYGNYITAHTSRYVVYEFWHCMFEDPQRIYNILTSKDFAFEDDLFTTLQENWPKFKNQYIRSSLFFLLNRCSDCGMISYGKLDTKNYTKVALTTLKAFKKPQNLIVNHTDKTLIQTLSESIHSDYRIINAGTFRLNLFDHGRNYGLEESKINHKRLLQIIAEKKHKTIAIYKFSNLLLEELKNHSLHFKLLNQYGNITEDHKSAAEVLIANF